MLDTDVHFSNSTTGAGITKQAGMIDIETGTADKTIDTIFEPSGSIMLNTWTNSQITTGQPANGTGEAAPVNSQEQNSFVQTSTNYYPNGSITYVSYNSTAPKLLQLTSCQTAQCRIQTAYW